MNHTQEHFLCPCIPCLPWELLYADDLVIWAETKFELLAKVDRWKQGLEAKGLRVNMDKTKVVQCSVDCGQKESTGKYPCSVCRRGVGSNSIQCSSCKLWVHKRCSGVRGRLKVGLQFCCKTYVSGTSNRKEVRR